MDKKIFWDYDGWRHSASENISYEQYDWNKELIEIIDKFCCGDDIYRLECNSIVFDLLKNSGHYNPMFGFLNKKYLVKINDKIIEPVFGVYLDSKLIINIEIINYDMTKIQYKYFISVTKTYEYYNNSSNSNTAVICVNKKDFEEWKIENNFQKYADLRGMVFNYNGHKYICVFETSHLRNFSINQVIETKNARLNENLQTIYELITRRN